MFELLLALTGLALGAGMVLAYQRTGDVLHPMLFLGPLFLYGTVVEPWLMRSQMDRFFRYQQDIEVVLYLYLLSVAALVFGVLHHAHTRRAGGQTRLPIRHRDRVNLQRIARLLAAVGLAAYAYGILNVGGFVAAFSRVKGGGETSSGYIGEAMNLGLVAAALVALARYRRGWTQGTLILLLLGLLPNLVQGTFGGRRGPLFLALMGLVVAWLITRPRRPRLPALCCALAGVLLSVALVWSQRSFLYLGSDEPIDWGAFETTLSLQEIDEGSNFVYGTGFVTATRQAGQFTWGRELAVNLLVRPIPRQVWPTKYEDVGAVWVTNEYPGLGHLTTDDWLDGVGWIPLAGSSAISISDLFGEFGWGAVLAMYLVGRGFAFLRSRRLSHGGVWDLLYFEALILSIYLATQSFSAFYHRYLILAIPTIIAWRLLYGRSRDSQARVGASRITPLCQKQSRPSSMARLLMVSAEARPRVLVAQLGARRHYLVPRALAEGGHLERFCTDLYFGYRPWLDPAIASILGPRAAAFEGRCHPNVPMRLVSDFPSVQLLSLAARGSDSQRWIGDGRRFGESVVRSGFGRANAVMAFSSAALEIFQAARSKRIATVLDHATAPRDREMAVVADEERRFPQWADAPVLQDLALERYSQRQAEERALADRIICGSRFVAGILQDEGVDPSKIRIVPLGISTHAGGSTRNANKQGHALNVLFVGNEGLRKGLGYLLEAVKTLGSSMIRLRIAGNPGFTPKGMAQVNEVCEECRPVPRSEIQDWYDWADVLVLPSLSDTFGLVILEAMSSGVPVITTHASGGPDVIRDGVDGWLVPLRDPMAIAHRLDTLMSTPKLATEMGRSARERSAEFDSAAYRRRLLEAITS